MDEEDGQLPDNVMETVHRVESRFPNDLVAVFDERGRYRYASKWHEKYLGYSRKEFTGGLHWTDIVSREYHEIMELKWEDSRLTGKSIDLTFTVETRDGQVMKVRGNSQAVDGDDGQFYRVARAWLA